MSLNRVKEVFGKDGVLAHSLKDYEVRREQEEMAEAICSTLTCGRHLVVEAGTGVGKSWAYLIPLSFWSVENKKRVIVSTYTKALQQQLVEKDLPFLKDVLGIDFKFALCLGAGNYLCPWRLNRSVSQGLFDTGTEQEELRHLWNWSLKTTSGLRLDLDFEVSNRLWEMVCRESDLCLDKKCPHFHNCFYFKAYRERFSSHILIVNHHLYFTNLVSGGGVLPQAEVVVFDESHNLEDVATDYLGLEFSNSGLKFLLDSLYNPVSGKGLLNRMAFLKQKKLEKSHNLLEDARQAGEVFFKELSDKIPEGETVRRIHSDDFVSNSLNKPLLRIISHLKKLLDEIKEEEDRFEISVHIQRLETARSALRKILDPSLMWNGEGLSFLGLEQKEEGFVYWVESEPKRARPIYRLRAAPVNVGDALNKLIFEETEHVILTSATMTTQGNFNFLKSRLGLEECNEVILGSPFNYKEQALLYLPDGISEPGKSHEEYLNSLVQEVENILEITGGRAFVLFTSYGDLDRIYSELSTRVSKYPIFRQGDMSPYRLLEGFKETEGSVLLGTTTFWQGIDVPGSALECVIITRLPFSVPDEPVIEARLEELKRDGKNPFLQYQVPQAILRLKQGFGRLIRRKDDFGIVAILDPRIKTRYYGKLFLESLPPCRHADSLKDIEEFLNLKLSLSR